jgi:hypothetical protein
MPVGLKQQSCERRSQVDAPQTGTVYDEQLPASPPELLDEEPPLEDDELPPEEELPEEEELPAPDEEAAPDEDVPPEEELLDEEASTVASRTSIEASAMADAWQYLPPRGDVAQMSPAGHSAVVVQSW